MQQPSRPVDPVIFIPGVTASELRDQYDLPPSDLWTPIQHRNHTRITLHPQNLSYEALEPALVAPGHVFELIYEELIEELRDDLSRSEEEQVPVYPFAYDWRQPLENTQQRLGEFVGEVIRRTSLMAHYHNAGYPNCPKVNLIAHSMGGLVVAGYLHNHASHHVSKVVTLATPFKGACDSVVELVTGTGRTFLNPSKARKRRAVRFTPSVYHLLPTYAGALEFENGLVSDIFNRGAWQPSILESMGRSAARWSVAQDGAESAKEAFDSMLFKAKNHRQVIDNLNLRELGFNPKRWLAIVGLDAPTVVKIRIQRTAAGTPQFAVDEADAENEWNENDAQNINTGDGTVPLAAAIPNFVPKENLVCVKPGDFRFGERYNPPALRFAGFHAQIPTMDLVHRIIVRFLTDAGNPYNKSRGMRLPGVPLQRWNPPVS